MERSILASVLVIGVVATMLGAGTVALFSDTEEVGQNTFTAGTLDLTVNGQNPCTEHITVKNMKPGGEIRNYFTLVNIGSLPGTITVEFSEITNKEHGRTEPEIAAGDIYGDGGELGANLEVWFFSMKDGTPAVRMEDNVGNPVWSGTILNTLGGKTFYVPQQNDLATIEPGETQICKIWFTLPEDTGNIVQSDSVEFDIIFHLDQA